LFAERQIKDVCEISKIGDFYIFLSVFGFFFPSKMLISFFTGI
jgi:hypothetical protein